MHCNLPASSSRCDADDARPRVVTPVDSIVRQARQPVASALLVLGDLVPLRKVGVEVVLAGKDRSRAGPGSLTPGRCPDAATSTARSVQYGQRARQAEAHRTDRWLFGGRTEGRATPAEDLGLRQELRVDLEADDGLKSPWTASCPGCSAELFSGRDGFPNRPSLSSQFASRVRPAGTRLPAHPVGCVR